MWLKCGHYRSLPNFESLKVLFEKIIVNDNFNKNKCSFFGKMRHLYFCRQKIIVIYVICTLVYICKEARLKASPIGWTYYKGPRFFKQFEFEDCILIPFKVLRHTVSNRYRERRK